MGDKKDVVRGSSTKIVSCSCKNEYQDKKYGAGKRVANLSAKTGEHSCTVCGKKHK